MSSDGRPQKRASKTRGKRKKRRKRSLGRKAQHQPWSTATYSRESHHKHDTLWEKFKTKSKRNNSHSRKRRRIELENVECKMRDKIADWSMLGKETRKPLRSIASLTARCAHNRRRKWRRVKEKKKERNMIKKTPVFISHPPSSYPPFSGYLLPYPTLHYPSYPPYRGSHCI